MATTTVDEGTSGARTPVSGQKPKSRAWGVFRTYFGVAIIVIWGLAPFYWMVVTSFRTVSDTYQLTLLPTTWTLDNYRTAFSTDLGNFFGRSLVNSLIIGGASTLIGIVVGVFAAYALSRLQFKGKYLVTGFILGASMFPGVALVTPLFQLFTDIGWFGTYQALIIPNISFVLPLTIYTLTAFFREMPWELEEAAKIDGATPGQAFRKVIFPLAAPGVFTTAILAFIAAWNEFIIASQLSNERTAPVTVAIANFTGAQPRVEPYTAIMAAGTVVTIPLIIMVLALQRKIVAGLTAGGVKG